MEGQNVLERIRTDSDTGRSENPDRAILAGSKVKSRVF